MTANERALRCWMRLHARAIVIVACGVLALGVIGKWIYAKEQSIYGTPSCSWPMRVQGTATPQQVGLVRCYLKAIAEHDTGELQSIARNDPPARITSSDFKYSRDASVGTATATFTPNPVDSTVADVTIRFGNGVVERDAGVINMISMGGPSVWRMDI